MVTDLFSKNNRCGKQILRVLCTVEDPSLEVSNQGGAGNSGQVIPA